MIVRNFNLNLSKPKVLPFDFRLCFVSVNFVRNYFEMATRMLLIEAALREERLERRRRRRHLRNQCNIGQIPDLEFVGHFRLSRQLFEVLCQEIVPLLPPKARRHGIEPTLKILTALNFYARGGYQGSVGQNMDGPMAQQTVSRCLKEVTTALNAPHILRKYIKFPQNRNDRNLIKQGFYEKYGLPGVIGCIDCTHIAIVRPSEHEEQYFNRKHFHSINTQVICDSDCYITNVDASFGGATHDAYIWRECDIKSHMEGLQNETVYLLGDSGYAQREYMMTPIDNAVEDSPEGRYNSIQKRARSTIERTFGILKGEYVLQGELPSDLVSEESSFNLLEEALQLVELGDEVDTKDEQTQAVEGSSSSEMLHPAMRHVPHHPLAHYHNQSLMRSMSVEQRWQDLASLLTIPPPPDQYQHYHQHSHPHPHPHAHPHAHAHPHNISHGAAAAYAPNYHPPLPSVPEKHHESYGAAAPLEGAYKVESAHHPQHHDGIYYQNSTSEMAPPNQDGFLQSILNDEDLQLMDMAMNEGMYTMRMLDGASSAHVTAAHTHTHMPMTTERDSASDSAVSSMGSERVPSLSDGEWCDGSDSAQEFHSSKFRPYDSAYGRERASHAPQKKHHMFGKRCFQEQPTAPIEPIVASRPPGVIKYECEQTYHDSMHMHNVEYNSRPQLAPPHVPALQPALDINTPHSSHALLQSTVPSPGPRFGFGSGDRVRHNHTYSAPLPAERQPPRDKRVRRLTDGSTSDGGCSTGSHLSRDEKRAKALGIPLEVQDIINLPMDEFNERLSKHDLSEAQLSLIRDIRRRGKNKVAAQNCRKRKLDQITSLADEVRTVRDRKARTQRDHHNLLAERQRVKERFAALYRHVFQNLRDQDGRPLSSAQYSLQQAADGNVVLVPKMQHSDHPMNRTSDDDLDRKAKSYDQ